MADFYEDYESMDETSETPGALAVSSGSNELAPKGFYDRISEQVANYGYFSTFEVATRDDSKKIYNATQTASTLSQAPGDIALVDMVFAPVTITDKDGLTHQEIAVYLIDANGASWMSASKGVVSCAASLLSSFGNPSTWGEPLVVGVQETTTRRGLPYKTLVLR